VAVVSNSSPLIALAEIEHLPLLAELFGSILIPSAVAAESARTISTHPTWLRVEPLKTSIRPDVMRPSLGRGQREALTPAADLAADWLIVDDLAAADCPKTGPPRKRDSRRVARCQAARRSFRSSGARWIACWRSRSCSAPQLDA